MCLTFDDAMGKEDSYQGKMNLPSPVPGILRGNLKR